MKNKMQVPRNNYGIFCSWKIVYPSSVYGRFKAIAVCDCGVLVVAYSILTFFLLQKLVPPQDLNAPLSLKERWSSLICVVNVKLQNCSSCNYRGIARHCNYLGDLLLALSFSLPCGVRWVIIFCGSSLLHWRPVWTILIHRLQFRHPILLPHVPADSTDLEGKAWRGEVLAEIQGDLGRVLQARALEDPALCVLKRR